MPLLEGRARQAPLLHRLCRLHRMLLSRFSRAKCMGSQGCHISHLYLSSGRRCRACLLRSLQSERHSSRAVRKEAHACLPLLHQQSGPRPRLCLRRQVQRLVLHPGLQRSRQADRRSLSGGRRLAYACLACPHARTGQQACLQLSRQVQELPQQCWHATSMCTLACSLGP